MSDIKFKKIHDFLWEIPKENKMNVPGRIYASKKMLDKIREDNSPVQVQNVSQLPGIVKFSMAMPDIHWGYGFPIGGVAAFDLNDGVISPGGVGYDINCGVRLLKTALTRDEIQDKTGNDPDNILGHVDWKTAKVDDKGVFVERVLNRRNKYMQWLERLVKSGLVGSSSLPVKSTSPKM